MASREITTEAGKEVESVLQSKIQDETGATKKPDHSNPSDGHSKDSEMPSSGAATPSIKCEYCDMTFFSEQQLRGHRRIHRPKNTCKRCGKSFVMRLQLEKHMKSHENEVKTEPPEEFDSALGQELGSEADQSSYEQWQHPLKLEQDSVEYNEQLENEPGLEDMIDVEEVKIEVRKDDDVEPDESSAVFYGPGLKESPAAEVKTKEEEKNDQKFQCNKCFKWSKSRQALWCHNKIVHGPRNYPCTTCGYRFVKQVDLDQHFRSAKHLKKLQETQESEATVAMGEDTEKDKAQTNSDNAVGVEDTVCADTETVQAALPSPDVSKETIQNPLDSPKVDDIVPDRSSSPDQQVTTTENNDDRYGCTKCNRTFNRQCQLKRHMEIHDKKAKSLKIMDEGDSSLAEEDDSDYSDNADRGEIATDDEQQLKCGKCDKVFHRLDRGKLTSHLRNKHGPKIHVCSICERPFRSRVSMENHKKTHQPKRKRQRLRKGEADDAVRPYKCDICPSAFKKPRVLADHKRYQHGPKNYECEICGFRFSQRFYLHSHMQIHARCRDSKEDFLMLRQIQCKEESKTPDDSNDNGEEVNSGESTKDSIPISTESSQTPNETESSSANKCGKCNRVFKDQRMLYAHYKYAHKKKMKCSLCTVVFTSNKRLVIHMIKRHQKQDGTFQPLKCEECDKVFSSTSQLTAHKIVHKPKIICCKLCPKTFNRSQHLKSHMQSHEEVPDDFMIPARIRKGYECEICHKVMQFKKHMYGHIRKVHGPQLHECSICSKLFLKREDMELHVKNHDNAPNQHEDVQTINNETEKTNICSDETTENNSKTVKEIRKEPSTNDPSPDSESELSKGFKCGECHRQFLSEKNLYNHIKRMHEPKNFMCSICGKAFLLKQYLLRHEPTHRNDNKSLSCTKCNRTFPSWRKTYMHMRNHELHYKCQVCRKLFLNTSNFSEHLKTHGLEFDEKTMSRYDPSKIIKPPPKRKRYPCSMCTKILKSMVKLKAHVEESHPESAKQNENKEQPKANESQGKDCVTGSPEDPVLLFEAEEFKIEPEQE